MDQHGGMNFVNGVATIVLKHGESKTAAGLPAGITYTVAEEEANQDGYITSSTGASGTIPENDTAAAAFVNEKNHSDPDEPDEPDKPDEPDEPDKPGTPDTPNPSDNVPKTGDETNLTLWLMLMSFSGLAMISIPVLYRSRYKGRHCKSKAKK